MGIGPGESGKCVYCEKFSVSNFGELMLYLSVSLFFSFIITLDILQLVLLSPLKLLLAVLFSSLEFVRNVTFFSLPVVSYFCCSSLYRIAL